MENSAYVPSAGHMSSPALVVFSQATGGLPEALRIQRPFNPQLQLSDATAKDLHRPFSGTGFSIRHMEAYNSLPAHLLHHLQPQFLHPSLSLGSGAFRPLADLKTFPSPSAFGPPKSLKIETGTDGGVMVNNHAHSGMFSPGDERLIGTQRTDSCSPASISLSPPAPPPSSVHHVKEESMDAQVSEDGDRPASCTPGPCLIDADSHSHDENKGFRLGAMIGSGFGGCGYTFPMSGPDSATRMSANPNNRSFKHNFLLENPASLKKKRNSSFCPICGLALSSGELESHFMHELERLYKLSDNNRVNLSMKAGRRPDIMRPAAHTGDSGPEGRWETYQRIKTNRQGRLRSKLRKRKLDGTDSCPICMDRLHRSSEDINMHADECVRKSGVSGSNDEDETVDVEGDSEFEEWTTNNQSRVQGTPLSLSFNSSSTNVNGLNLNRENNLNDKESEDVIVDGNENDFGPTQYSESDVAIASANESVPREQNADGIQSQVTTSSGDVDIKVESGLHCDNNVSTTDSEPSTRTQVLEDLKSRIRQLEAETGSDAATSTESPEEFKCLVCLEQYKKPVISTVCWHVHCEECWLHTLGTKKMCPQCSMITTPSDLRRIFM